VSFEAEGANVEIPEGAPAPAEAAPVEAAPEVAAPAGDAAVVSRLDSLTEQFGEFLRRMPPPAEEEHVEEELAPEPISDAALEALLAELPEDAIEDGVLTARGLDLLVQKRTDERIAAALAQRDSSATQAAAAERRERELEALEQRFPFMQDQAHADRVVDAAAERAQRLVTGAGLDPRALLTPAFIEEQIGLMYPEGLPETAAQPEVQLERPSAAAPASAQQGTDEGDAIVAAMGRGRHAFG
jgi:hypothetical protein